MSLITDEVYNNLNWERYTVDALEDLIKGAVVLEVEAIDAPLIDGVALTLKGTSGEVIVVSLDADTDNYININDVIRSHKNYRAHRQYLELTEYEDAEEAQPLYISVARVPADRLKG